MSTTTTDYELEAKRVLAECGGKLKIVLSDTKLPPWDKATPNPRHHYRCALTGPGGTYTFDFWGSIADCANGKEIVSEYDVLACLEWNTPEDFEDFCNEFGYDTDSRNAEKTWKACLSQIRALKRIFPSETAREALGGIR